MPSLLGVCTSAVYSAVYSSSFTHYSHFMGYVYSQFYVSNVSTHLLTYSPTHIGPTPFLMMALFGRLDLIIVEKYQNFACGAKCIRKYLPSCFYSLYVRSKYVYSRYARTKIVYSPY